MSDLLLLPPLLSPSALSVRLDCCSYLLNIPRGCRILTKGRKRFFSSPTWSDTWIEELITFVCGSHVFSTLELLKGHIFSTGKRSEQKAWTKLTRCNYRAPLSAEERHQLSILMHRAVEALHLLPPVMLWLCLARFRLLLSITGNRTSLRVASGIGLNRPWESPLAVRVRINTFGYLKCPWVYWMCNCSFSPGGGKRESKPTQPAASQGPGVAHDTTLLETFVFSAGSTALTWTSAALTPADILRRRKHVDFMLLNINYMRRYRFRGNLNIELHTKQSFHFSSYSVNLFKVWFRCTVVIIPPRMMIVFFVYECIMKTQWRIEQPAIEGATLSLTLMQSVQPAQRLLNMIFSCSVILNTRTLCTLRSWSWV